PPGLRPEGLNHGIARRSEDLDPGRGVERFRIRLRGALANNAHVELHGCRIGMHLHDRDLGAIGADVLVEREQTRLSGVDELDEPRHTIALSYAVTGLETVGGNEDERCGLA